MTYKLPKGWKEVELKDVGEIITGKTPKTKNKENFNGKIPFLTPSDNMENRFVNKTARTLSEIGADTVKNQIIPRGSISVSCIGSQLGKVVITKQKTVTNQQINSVIVNENINNMFIYYSMLMVGERIRHISKTSTAVPIINKTNFSKEKIILPSLPEQKVIADTLSSLDNKIELNNKINQNLEQQAQTIFKHWFVDFEFPDENGNPYKSSGGEMVESELGMIPKGWEVKKIKEISEDIVLGKTPKTSDKENFGGDIPFLTIPDMHDKVYVDNTARTLTEKGVNTQANKTVPINSICVSCIATPGLVTITKEPTQTNQQINTIIPKIRYTYVYSYMKSISGKIISLGSGGTTTNNLNKTQFSNIEIIVPGENHLERFHEIIKNVFNLINLNQTQNQKLSQLRDTLLPKLMSGEIRIPLD